MWRLDLIRIPSLHKKIRHPRERITEKEMPVPFEGKSEIAFISNGMPKVADGMMTLLIFFRGYPQEGRKIMISMGGRIRMGRGKE